jgi:hypothetical protein
MHRLALDIFNYASVHELLTNILVKLFTSDTDATSQLEISGMNDHHGGENQCIDLVLFGKR